MKFKDKSGIYVNITENNILAIGSVSDSDCTYVILKNNPNKVYTIPIKEKELRNNIKTLF